MSTHTLDPLGEDMLLAATENPSLSQSVSPPPPSPPPAEIRPLDKLASMEVVLPPDNVVNSMDWGDPLKFTSELPVAFLILKHKLAIMVPRSEERRVGKEC